MDHRKTPRFPVQFRSSFSSANIVSGVGVLNDLSSGGCRIFSTTSVKPGTTLALCIEMFGEEPPMQIKQVVVRWCRDGQFGVEFLSLAPEDWARLQLTIKELERQPYEREQQSETAT
ncbi:MAG: PilZ domain-containing protein [Nitrospira sp.]|nr:PilZ domain-containing protein [Nitrospira sp.]